ILIVHQSLNHMHDEGMRVTAAIVASIRFATPATERTGAQASTHTAPGWMLYAIRTDWGRRDGTITCCSSFA
ncbi:MAG: hypothetical protein ABGY72_25255, partial [bacterium]